MTRLLRPLSGMASRLSRSLRPLSRSLRPLRRSLRPLRRSLRPLRRSLRWRLALALDGLALVAVLLVGTLALSLVRRAAAAQEASYLLANAQGVASQVTPALQPRPDLAALQELVYQASFLGNMQVRVLDEEARALVDSGPPTRVRQAVWIALPEGQTLASLPVGALALLGDLLGDFSLDEVRVAPVPLANLASLQPLLPAGTTITRLDRTPEGWVQRVRQRVAEEGALLRLGGPEMLSVRGVALDALLDAARSTATVVVPIGGDGDGGMGLVEVRNGPALAQSTVDAARGSLIVGGLVALVAIGAAGLALGYRLARPLQRLADTAERMAAGDLSVRTDVDRADEIGRLAANYNRMAGALERSFSALQAERDALRRFVADASHELRTPITALSNYNELLRGPAADDPAAQDEFLGESARQIERLRWIVQNLLDLSRYDAGLIELDRAAHDVGDLIEAVVATWRPQAQEEGITLETAAEAHGLTVVADRPRLELALGNLLGNALKFTPEGGRVGVGARAANGRVRIWVRDNGPGIPPDDLPHLFERFYRGQGTRQEGSGLGLAIVRSIVVAHGGEAGVESEPGQGSTFWVELPGAEGG